MKIQKKIYFFLGGGREGGLGGQGGCEWRSEAFVKNNYFFFFGGGGGSGQGGGRVGGSGWMGTEN